MSAKCLYQANVPIAAGENDLMEEQDACLPLDCWSVLVRVLPAPAQYCAVWGVLGGKKEFSEYGHKNTQESRNLTNASFTKKK